MAQQRNIAVRLRFDGAGYHGWQLQKDKKTLCGTVADALREITGEEIRLCGCGRTDAGVHAQTYVANFHTACAIPAQRLPYALNAKLPGDIAALDACEVGPRFDATRSCVKKEYTYRMLLTPHRDPFLSGRVWHYPRSLDIGLMHAAAQAFVGRHDFAAMQSVGTVLKSTVREIYGFTVEQNGDTAEFRVSADGFLYNMARAMVGTLVYVSEGKIRPGDIEKILCSRDRSLAGPTAPAAGLYMTGVWYPDGEVVFHAGK